MTVQTYDQHRIVSECAIEVTGLVAEVIAAHDVEYIRNTLLRLFWLVNDESGSIGWRAPELIREILFHCPNDQFFPILISLLDLETEDAPRFRSGTLWAIGRVAQATVKSMGTALPQDQKYALFGEDAHTKRMAQPYVSKKAK